MVKLGLIAGGESDVPFPFSISLSLSSSLSRSPNTPSWTFVVLSSLTPSIFPSSSALLAGSAAAFAPAGSSRTFRTALPAIDIKTPEVDAVGNNLQVKSILTEIEDSQLLSKVAKAGLLSKAQKAGIKLSSLEPLLAFAASNKDVMVLVESAGPEVLPLLPPVVSLAPSLLPLLGVAIQIPPVALAGVGIGALAAAGGAVIVIPDDTVVQVAAQTLAVGLLAVAGGASLAGSVVLGKITS